MASEDFSEELANYVQRIGALEQQVEAMTVHRTEGGLNAMSLRVAQLIEDEFSKHHDGGRSQRLAKCQIIVREAAREMLVGERQWNAWHPDSVLAPPARPAGGTP